MPPAAIEGPRNTGALIVISVKSAHHRAAMSAGKLEPNQNANFPSKNKLPSTNRQIEKLKRDTLKPAYFIIDFRFQIWNLQFAICILNPNVAYLYRGKTRKSVSDVVAHRLGQIEAYFTVREDLSEASTPADAVLSRERSGFYWCRYATLG